MVSTTHMKLIQPAHSAFQHPLLEYSAFHRPLRGLPPPCPYPRRPQRVSISSRAGLTYGESPPCDWRSTRSASTEPSPWQARCTASWRRGGRTGRVCPPPKPCSSKQILTRRRYLPPGRTGAAAADMTTHRNDALQAPRHERAIRKACRTPVAAGSGLPSTWIATRSSHVDAAGHEVGAPRALGTGGTAEHSAVVVLSTAAAHVALRRRQGKQARCGRAAAPPGEAAAGACA